MEDLILLAYWYLAICLCILPMWLAERRKNV